MWKFYFLIEEKKAVDDGSVQRIEFKILVSIRYKYKYSPNGPLPACCTTARTNWSKKCTHWSKNGKPS